MRIRVVAIAAVLLIAAGSPLLAQTSCDDALREAQKSYDLGLFEDVPEQLAPCLATRSSRRTAVQVHSLLARAYLNNDDVERARKEVSTLLRLDSTFEAGPSPRFAALVAEVRREELTTQVASVSKTSESLREAPATVVVVTGEEIQKRGYLDLEQLLHDLPGFDISRLNGGIYSSIYQRGYHGPTNDRLLLLVDGVEQSDLSSGIASISRQYPLSNVDRIEVIYGPASTMYGANAYTGVISVLTKEPEAYLGESRSFHVGGQVAAGQYGLRTADVLLNGRDRNGTVAWSIAGRFHEEEARDLTGFDQWDYSYRNFDYRNFMRLTGESADAFIGQGHCAQPSPYFQCLGAAAGQRTVELTEEGERLVRGLDSQLVLDQGVGFEDRAKNWSVNAKLRISNLTVGLQSWRSQEGIGSSYGALVHVAGNTTWTPGETAVYLKYSVPLERVKLAVFTRYEQTTLERSGSRFDYLHNYASGFLSMWSLVPPCASPADPEPVSCAPASPWVEQVTFGMLSTQLRNEISAVYETSDKYSAVAGLEFTKSSIQSQFDQTPTGPGYVIGTLEEPEQTEHTDTAVYAQVTYKPRRSLRLVGAGRLSYNQIHDKPGYAGFGMLFTPRLGVIYSPGARRLVLKAIYSEAFKDPTDGEKFGVLRYFNEHRSLGLEPERVSNMEVSADWQPIDRVSLEAAVYQADYKDVVGSQYARKADGTLIDCVSGCLQYANRDQFRVRGLQASARYRMPRSNVWLNYTWTDPMQLSPEDIFREPLRRPDGTVIESLRVADIARHHLNLGVDTDWSNRWSTALRVHHVGARPTGEGTTFASSPFRQTDAHTTASAAIHYRELLPGATLSLIVHNLLDTEYFDPGSFSTAPRVLQSGRAVSFRLSYGLPFQR